MNNIRDGRNPECPQTRDVPATPERLVAEPCTREMQEHEYHDRREYDQGNRVQPGQRAARRSSHADSRR